MPFVVYRTRMARSYCKTLLCLDCGLTFCDIRFDNDEMHRLYVGYRDESYIRERERYEPGYRERQAGFSDGLPYIAEIEDFLRPHLGENIRILDWGGGTGINTPFKKYPSDVYDISGAPVKYGRKVAHVGKFDYDLIVFANVIEHTPYPAKLLTRIIRKMRRDTVLYIEVSLDDAAGKTKWHEHINVFTEGALHRLVERCGLEVLGTRKLVSPPYHPYLMATRIA